MKPVFQEEPRGTLPNGTDASSVEAETSAQRNMAGAHDLTICLVDDDPSVLKATGRLLSSAGWSTKPFTDPLAFLRYAEASRPPLVVLDIWMPGMNGLEVQAQLRSVSPETRVVILTSKDDPSVRSKALEGGASAFFLKPVSDCEFLHRIESISLELNGAASRREN